MNTEYTSRIKRIAIIDDNPANRSAVIIAIKELLPDASIAEFDNTEDGIDAINEPSIENPQPDFVISDMSMEEEQSGWQVATVAWSWRIPVIVVSGGIKGHGKDLVVMGYPDHQVVGEKDDPAVWKQIIEVALSGDYKSNALLTALEYGKTEFSDIDAGKMYSVCSVATILSNNKKK